MRLRIGSWVAAVGLVSLAVAPLGAQAPSAELSPIPLPAAMQPTSPIGMPLPDGRFLFIERRQAEIWLVDLASQKADLVGRSGRGPGEYVSPLFSGSVADSLWVSDWGLRRTTLMASDGRVLRTERPPPRVLSGASAYPRAMLVGGRKLAQTTRPTTRVMREGGVTEEVFWLDSEDQVVFSDTLDTRLADLVIPLSGGGVVHASQPWVTNARFTVGHSGRHVWIARALKGGIRLWRRDHRGDLLESTTVEYSPPTLTDTEVDRWVEEMLASYGDAVDPAELRRGLLDELIVPSTWPTFDQLVPAFDGGAWLGHPLPSGERVWRKICPSGREPRNGVVRLPASVQTLLDGRDQLLALGRDALDVPTVSSVALGGSRPGLCT